MSAHAPGFPAIVAAVAAMIVWAAHFGIVYAAHAVACARGLAGRTLLGQPVVTVLVLGVTAIALIAVAAVALRASPQLHAEENPGFMAWFAMAIALLSAIAILWQGVPVLLVPSCG